MVYREDISEKLSVGLRKNFRFSAALKLFTMSRKQAGIHYAEYRGKLFFLDLVEFITSGPIIAMIIKGPNAIKSVRLMLGPRNPAEARGARGPGTIPAAGGFCIED